MKSELRTSVTLFGAAALIIGLSACAPEPGEGGGSDASSSASQSAPGGGSPDDIAGKGGKGSKGSDSESSWAQPNDDVDVNKRTTQLPDSFPSDAFPLPAGAEIFNAGERAPGVWFVILLAPNAESVDSLWDQVIQGGGFSVADESSTPEGGRAAQLSRPTLRVTAVTLPQADGSVQLSYDLTRTP